jgi:hypothetical protein
MISKNFEANVCRPRGVHSLLCFAYTCFQDLFIGGGVIYLAKKIIMWWYFTCKKPKNIICDGILHVNMFHYFKIPCFTCTFFYKIYLQWIYWTLFFLSHVVLRFSPVISPRCRHNLDLHPKKTGGTERSIHLKHIYLRAWSLSKHLTM